LTLQATLNSYLDTVKDLELSLETNANASGTQLLDFASSLEAARSQCKIITAAIHRKRVALSVDGRLNLQNLRESKYLQLRMNARALKSRIRSRLQQRKFELERLERAYQHNSSGAYFCFSE
jgi:DNA-binding transcriptional regulator YbjK